MLVNMHGMHAELHLTRHIYTCRQVLHLKWRGTGSLHVGFCRSTFVYRYPAYVLQVEHCELTWHHHFWFQHGSCFPGTYVDCVYMHTYHSQCMHHYSSHVTCDSLEQHGEVWNILYAACEPWLWVSGMIVLWAAARQRTGLQLSQVYFITRFSHYGGWVGYREVGLYVSMPRDSYAASSLNSALFCLPAIASSTQWCMVPFSIHSGPQWTLLCFASVVVACVLSNDGGQDVVELACVESCWKFVPLEPSLYARASGYTNYYRLLSVCRLSGVHALSPWSCKRYVKVDVVVAACRCAVWVAIPQHVGPWWHGHARSGVWMLQSTWWSVVCVAHLLHACADDELCMIWSHSEDVCWLPFLITLHRG